LDSDEPLCRLPSLFKTAVYNAKLTNIVFLYFTVHHCCTICRRSLASGGFVSQIPHRVALPLDPTGGLPSQALDEPIFPNSGCAPAIHRHPFLVVRPFKNSAKRFFTSSPTFLKKFNWHFFGKRVGFREKQNILFFQ